MVAFLPSYLVLGCFFQVLLQKKGVVVCCLGLCGFSFCSCLVAFALVCACVYRKQHKLPKIKSCTRRASGHSLLVGGTFVFLLLGRAFCFLLSLSLSPFTFRSLLDLFFFLWFVLFCNNTHSPHSPLFSRPSLPSLFLSFSLFLACKQVLLLAFFFVFVCSLARNSIPLCSIFSSFLFSFRFFSFLFLPAVGVRHTLPLIHPNATFSHIHNTHHHNCNCSCGSLISPSAWFQGATTPAQDGTAGIASFGGGRSPPTLCRPNNAEQASPGSPPLGQGQAQEKEKEKGPVKVKPRQGEATPVPQPRVTPNRPQRSPRSPSHRKRKRVSVWCCW